MKIKSKIISIVIITILIITSTILAVLLLLRPKFDTYRFEGIIFVTDLGNNYKATDVKINLSLYDETPYFDGREKESYCLLNYNNTYTFSNSTVHMGADIETNNLFQFKNYKYTRLEVEMTLITPSSEKINFSTVDTIEVGDLNDFIIARRFPTGTLEENGYHSIQFRYAGVPINIDFIISKV